MFRLNFEQNYSRRSGQAQNKIAKVIITAATAIFLSFMLCEYMIKPLWHLLSNH